MTDVSTDERSVATSMEPTTGSVRSNPRRVRRLLFASDAVAIVVGVVAATIVKQLLNPVPAQASDHGYEVLGFTGDEVGERGDLEVLGSVGLLDPAMVPLTRVLADATGCQLTLSSSLHDIGISRTRSQAIDGRPMIDMAAVQGDE